MINKDYINSLPLNELKKYKEELEKEKKDLLYDIDICNKFINDKKTFYTDVREYRTDKLNSERKLLDVDSQIREIDKVLLLNK